MEISQERSAFLRSKTKFLFRVFFCISCIQNDVEVKGEDANLTGAGTAAGSRIEKILVSVFYETLCPYSVQFFRDQLIPTWEQLGQEYFDIRFIAYGNAHTFFQGGLVVTGCPHGDYECFGNRLHACVLEYLPKEVAREFIFCSMSLESPPDAATNNCTDALQEEYNFHSEIMEDCVSGLPGQLALALKGLQSLDFVTYGVPAIGINGVLASDDALENFLTFICERLLSTAELSEGFELPKACQRKD